ncbi:aminoacyl-tRNA hydrolase [Pseudodesulfovibrio sp. F-1]|uniref:Aminoacyl-tRNA hydrolase n=1 Tax=Pseudodesulfovibrio alkaliphilus TaxID=2661613 RepID=A0A7K1KRT4_9BACT|nr:alternative ribosome rescue aminoacyl-tRNA hydrolase ArfB [Pseudodesulfovibrio alkaliphilus]MUM78670.1 aminoacyl-tRNA hydrolase [Pseudodesulfovibrio alkaliphilus]
MLWINDTVTISDDEITYTASRSSGPGGQHVNTTDTRVTLIFDLAASNSLTPYQKERVLRALGGRIDKRGVLRVSSQSFRSQKSNKEEATARFVELVRRALSPVTPRRPTSVPNSAKRKRLVRKRHTAERKRRRKPPDRDE